MAKSKLVGLLFEAWSDMDRVVDGLDPGEAVQQIYGGSSYAWTYAHMGNSTDAWINVRMRNLAPHQLLGQEHFRFGGTGQAEEWQAIREGVREVRSTARTYLEGMEDDDLGGAFLQDTSFGGRLAPLSQHNVSLRYAILRLCAHHYYHIGEIGTKRDLRGQRVGDYPSVLEQCI